MSKKVYFVGGQYMGCWYYRCLLPLTYNNWSGNYLGLEKKLKPVELANREMMNADIVVFHRANTYEHHKVAMLLKQLGKKIVFDNDDTYKLDEYHPFFGLDDKGFKENRKKVNNVINNFIRNSDLVTCSTEYLAKEYKEINKNVHVLPNYIDEFYFDKPLRNNGKKVRIGIVGSVAYHHDFERIKDVIRTLSEDDNIEIVMFGLNKKTSDNPLISETYKKEFEFWDSIKMEHVPWVEMVDYFTTLNELRLDMMLIPRRENHFNKAKSNCKFLEAGMFEIPVIASSFKDGPYENDIDGENGILIKDDNDWLPEIYKLVNNKKLRRSMGKKAREYVLNNYKIQDHAYKWSELFENL